MKYDFLIFLTLLLFINLPVRREKNIAMEGRRFILPVPSNIIQNSNGEKVFRKNCASCHQIDGSGVPNLAPPLAGTQYVLGDKTRLIRIILNGLNTDIEIEGEHFNNPMPSFKKLKDRQIADVLTYIRNSFGNTSGGITSAEVKAVRRTVK